MPDELSLDMLEKQLQVTKVKLAKLEMKPKTQVTMLIIKELKRELTSLQLKVDKIKSASPPAQRAPHILSNKINSENLKVIDKIFVAKNNVISYTTHIYSGELISNRMKKDDGLNATLSNTANLDKIQVEAFNNGDENQIGRDFKSILADSHYGFRFPGPKNAISIPYLDKFGKFQEMRFALKKPHNELNYDNATLEERSYIAPFISLYIANKIEDPTYPEKLRKKSKNTALTRSDFLPKNPELQANMLGVGQGYTAAAQTLASYDMVLSPDSRTFLPGDLTLKTPIVNCFYIYDATLKKAKIEFDTKHFIMDPDNNAYSTFNINGEIGFKELAENLTSPTPEILAKMDYPITAKTTIPITANGMGSPTIEVNTRPSIKLSPTLILPSQPQISGKPSPMNELKNVISGIQKSLDNYLIDKNTGLNKESKKTGLGLFALKRTESRNIAASELLGLCNTLMQCKDPYQFYEISIKLQEKMNAESNNIKSAKFNIQKFENLNLVKSDLKTICDSGVKAIQAITKIEPKNAHKKLNTI